METKHVQFNWNNLTEEEKIKLNNIQRMLNSRKPFEEETQDIGEQTDFIKRHAKGQEKYFTRSYLMANPRRTNLLYYKVRESYVKEYRINRKKDERALPTLKRLLAKAMEEQIIIQQ